MARRDFPQFNVSAKHWTTFAVYPCLRVSAEMWIHPSDIHRGSRQSTNTLSSQFSTSKFLIRRSAFQLAFDGRLLLYRTGNRYRCYLRAPPDELSLPRETLLVTFPLFIQRFAKWFISPHERPSFLQAGHFFLPPGYGYALAHAKDSLEIGSLFCLDGPTLQIYSAKCKIRFKALILCFNFLHLSVR